MTVSFIPIAPLSLSSVEKIREIDKTMTKTIAFANLKGGTGKTTLCINIASYLAKSNEAKVLVVDFDPQGNATSGLGIDGNTLENSIYNAILDQCNGYVGVPITKIILQTEVENLHLAPSELNLAALSTILQKVPDRIGVLHRILKPIKKFYDYILIDAPSDSGLFILNSLRAADLVVVPLDPSIFALEALENLKKYFQDIEEMTDRTTSKFIIILNRYVKSTSKNSPKPSPSEDIENEIKEMSHTLFKVPDSLLVYKAQKAGLPISDYAPTSKLGKAYAEIANYLAID